MTEDEYKKKSYYLKDNCAIERDQKINLDECYKYINNFLNSSPNGRKFVNHDEYSIGVYFKYPDENALIPMQGYFFYPALFNPAGPDQYMVVMSGSSKLCNPGNYDEFAIDPKQQYYQSIDNIHLKVELPDDATIEDQLRQVDTELRAVMIKEATLTADLREIPNKIIEGRNKRYIDFFSEVPGDVVYGAGFMQKDSMDKLKNQKYTDQDGLIKNPEGFCCFLGYDKDLSAERIRLIFIAVKQDGHLLLDGNPVILERSWPPRRMDKTDPTVE